MSLSQSKHLTLTAIEESTEIQSWIAQFSPQQQRVAKSLLLQLRFVSRDLYSNWLLNTISNQTSEGAYALYAVRKMELDHQCLWDNDGVVIDRPGVSQGSEDLVYSLIANITRTKPDTLLDHPNLTQIKDSKIHNIILVDDSIGSGERVVGFINSMMKHKTFLSWWSAGFVKLHILSFARTRESEKRIVKHIRGSNHGLRKFPKSSKVAFTSQVVYSEEWLESRWGAQFQEILDLCDGQKVIPSFFQRGFGSVMANIVFYHSVPDNLPGALWYESDGWKALFYGRSLPDWVSSLLEQQIKATINELTENNAPVSNEMLSLLTLLKCGIRRISSIALRMNCDQKFVTALLGRAVYLGLISANNRLNLAGIDLLKRSKSEKPVFNLNRSMYIPKSWCAGQATIQPSTSEDYDLLELTESTEDQSLVDGEVGQTSLERSDAKAALPPLSVIPQQIPSRTRKGHDTHGPLGSKER